VGWIPTYAVLTGTFSRTDAAIFSTIFWTSSTICRFIVASLTMAGTRKMKNLIFLLSAFGLISLLLIQFGLFRAVIVFSSFSFGAATSGIFPLLLSIPA